MSSRGDAEGTFRRLVHAIDFGTAFSGVAWAQTARPDVQTTIMTFPTKPSGTLNGTTTEKVKTVIHPDGRWGSMIKDDEPCHKYFKLDLLAASADFPGSLAETYPDKTMMPTSYDKSAADLTTEYLMALRKHAAKVIIEQIGHAAYESTPHEYVITVPACCSEAEQERICQCAEKAGMRGSLKLYVCSEPEAAILYSLDCKGIHNLEVDDTYVIVDAGGGTVDCISYTITAVRPSVHVREAAPGSGSYCGSSYLNRIFQEWLETKFRDCPGWSDETLGDTMERFETVIKRQFDGDKCEEIMIPLLGVEDDATLGVRRGRYRMHGLELRAMFQRVFDDVVPLVKKQIESTKQQVKEVLLVGGFGESPFLLSALQSELGGIPVSRPPHGWTAVVRGALIKGFSEIAPSLTRIKIDSRVARKHYGITMEVPLNPITHSFERRKWSSFHGRYMVTVMSWFILRGDEFKENESIATNWLCQKLRSRGSFTKHSVQIYACTDDEDAGAPMYPDDPRIKPLANLTAIFDEGARSGQDIKLGKDGLEYYEIDFQIRLKFSSGRVEYSFWRDGRIQGTVSAEYD